ncbi:acyl carrier protein [Rhizobiaceae bacterium LC148]|nr:hypothetical protein YH62_04125 [Rhizobium sp. LC145]TKT65588.1 acyl carrier protein [Rhizobiaceae bacterium LC148]
MTANAACTLEQVQNTVAKTINKPLEEVKTSSSLGELGADDLDRIEIVMAVEKDCDASIPDDLQEKFVTVKDLHEAANKKSN